MLRSPRLGPRLWQLQPDFRSPQKEVWRQTCCCTHRAGLVIADRPTGNTFRTHALTADSTFMRFYDSTRVCNGNYSRSELDEWAGLLVRWSKEIEVFAYFNKDWERRD